MSAWTAIDSSGEAWAFCVQYQAYEASRSVPPSNVGRSRMSYSCPNCHSKGARIEFAHVSMKPEATRPSPNSFV